MGLGNYLERKNQEGGGRGILPNLFMNSADKLGNFIYKNYYESGVQDRQSQMETQNALANIKRRGPTAPVVQQPVQVQEVQPKPKAVQKPKYDSRYMNYLNNVRQGETLQDMSVPKDLSGGITAAALKTGIPEQLLYAIVNQETNFRNIAEENNPNGMGRGYFQIDLGQHPDVTEQQAMDPNWAALYASNLLNSRLKMYANDPAPVSRTIRAYNGDPYNNVTAPYLEGVQGYLGKYNYR